jgi:DNA primase large subunit
MKGISVLKGMRDDELSALSFAEFWRGLRDAQYGRHPTIGDNLIWKEVEKHMPEGLRIWESKCKATNTGNDGAKRSGFPPCISSMIEEMAQGGHLSHYRAFTLAAVLIETGHTDDEIVAYFRPNERFDERTTRYQIEHIRGRGYTHLTCETAQKNGICPRGCG